MSPVRSQLQAKKFFAMYKRGEIDKATLNEWTKGVKVSVLPKRVKQKKASRGK